jgi:hypothetical protein
MRMSENNNLKKWANDSALGLLSGVFYGSIIGFQKGTKISTGEIKSSLVIETEKIQTISKSRLRLFNMFHHGFRYGTNIFFFSTVFSGLHLFLFSKFFKNEFISKTSSGATVGSLFGFLTSIGRSDFSRLYYISYGGGLGGLFGLTYSLLSKPLYDKINELKKQEVSIEEIEEFKNNMEDLNRQKSIQEYIKREKKILKSFEKE